MNDHLVQITITILKEEFPDAKVWSAGVTVSAYERIDLKVPEARSEVGWDVQVDSEHGRGKTLDEALVELRQRIAFRATVPGLAERLAAVLRELPDEGFQRHTIQMAADNILRREDEATRERAWREELKRREESGQ